MPNFEISPIRHTLDSKHSLTRDYKINPLPNFETIYQRSHNSNRVNSDDASDQSEHSSFRSSLYLLHVIFHYQHHPAKKRNKGGIDSISRLFHSSSSAFPCETSDTIRIAIPTLIVSIDTLVSRIQGLLIDPLRTIQIGHLARSSTRIITLRRCNHTF